MYFPTNRLMGTLHALILLCCISSLIISIRSTVRFFCSVCLCSSMWAYIARLPSKLASLNGSMLLWHSLLIRISQKSHSSLLNSHLRVKRCNVPKCGDFKIRSVQNVFALARKSKREAIAAALMVGSLDVARCFVCHLKCSSSMIVRGNHSAT